MKTVSESIFSSKSVVIPMADVQHIEKHYYKSDLTNGIKKGDFQGISIITKHTKWDMDADTWANNIYVYGSEAESFLNSWCIYRHELEIDTLKDLTKNQPKMKTKELSYKICFYSFIGIFILMLLTLIIG